MSKHAATSQLDCSLAIAYTACINAIEAQSWSLEKQSANRIICRQPYGFNQMSLEIALEAASENLTYLSVTGKIGGWGPLNTNLITKYVQGFMRGVEINVQQALNTIQWHIQQGTLCPACGAQLTPGTRFCPNDGTPILKKCKQCGHFNKPNAKFCESCGSSS